MTKRGPEIEPIRPAQGKAATLSGRNFFRDLPTLDGFHHMADPLAYEPLPGDWIIGVADVVASTEAILRGRYKAVNTAGAAVVSAVSNALGTLDFPYVFTGDGMCYAVEPRQAAAARGALAASIAWVGAELDLVLRGGEISVAAIRSTGRDVRVARFAPSPDAVYAMFSGGGLVWVEDELKAGRLPVVAPDARTRPDLSGLSCRFSPIVARHGLILSMIVSPRGDGHGPAFQGLVADLVATVDASPEASLPVPQEGLSMPWRLQGIEQEARLTRKAGQTLLASRLATIGRAAVATAVMKAGRNIGTFSPSRYQRQLAANSDHRKFEDRLMMTIDCSPVLADAIESRLAAAKVAGVADFGTHRQVTALITCVVPSPTRPDHVHFIDGASGGYALAATALKRSRGDGMAAISALESNAIP